MSASKFPNKYDTGDQEFKNVANVAIVSEMDGLGWMNAYLTVNRKSEAAYCELEPNLTPDQLIDMLRRKVSTSPEFGAKPYGFAVAMQIRFDTRH